MDVYQFVCHTCNVGETFPNRAAAQAEFNDHAEQRHETALRRVESLASDPTPGSMNDGQSSNASEEEMDASGKDPVA